MLDNALDLDVEVLESLDFEIPCDHSQHNEGREDHGGCAEFVAKVTHECPVRPWTNGSVYVCCATWARKVNSHLDKPWCCPYCRITADGRDMVIILGPLDLM